MTKIKIFISRQLDDKSPFLENIDCSLISIQDEYLIDFSPLPFQPISTNWIFFYSKTGVQFYLEQNGNTKNHRIGVFGEGTGAYFMTKTGHKPDFIGTGKKKSVASTFAQLQDYQSSTFIVGAQSLRSVQEQLSHVVFKERIVYDNTPRTDFDIVNPNVAVFTSPMAVEAYFAKYPSRNHANIPIGQTTAKTLKDAQRNIYAIPKKPSEECLAVTVNSYLDNNIYKVFE